MVKCVHYEVIQCHLMSIRLAVPVMYLLAVFEQVF